MPVGKALGVPAEALLLPSSKVGVPDGAADEYGAEADLAELVVYVGYGEFSSWPPSETSKGWCSSVGTTLCSCGPVCSRLPCSSLGRELPGPEGLPRPLPPPRSILTVQLCPQLLPDTPGGWAQGLARDSEAERRNGDDREPIRQPGEALKQDREGSLFSPMKRGGRERQNQGS